MNDKFLHCDTLPDCDRQTDGQTFLTTAEDRDLQCGRIKNKNTSV